MQLQILLFTALLVLTMAFPQRPSYVPKPVDYPGVLPQYATGSSASADASSMSTATGGTLDNRFGQGQSQSGNVNTVPLVPANPLMDPYLANRVPDWPKEHLPFWYLNAQHIASHLNQPAKSQVVPAQSSFLGK